MDSSELAHVLQDPELDDPQTQLLQDTWLLALFAVLLATAFPWFVSGLNIDFLYASGLLLLLGAIYVGLAMVASLRPNRAAPRRRLLVALHLAGVAGIGVLWLYCGGLQNPAFLLAFVLPVIGASALSRWQPYVTAALALVVAGAVALVQAPELRWYVGNLHGVPVWLSALLTVGGQAPGAASGFPGFYAPVGYDLVLLEGLAILLLACAVATETLGDSFERVLEHLRVARSEAAHGQELWATLVTGLPIPALLVDVETQQIVLTSRQLGPFSPENVVLGGQPLLEAIHFSYPEPIEQMLTGKGESSTTAMVHAGEQLRVVQVQIQPLVYDGRQLALVLLQDTTNAYCLQAALDAQEQPALVIDAHARVIAANRSARALFPGATAGSDATQLIDGTEGARWWEPGISGRRRVQLTHRRRSYQATCTAVALPGEEESLYVASFASLAAGSWSESLVSATR